VGSARCSSVIIRVYCAPELPTNVQCNAMTVYNLLGTAKGSYGLLKVSYHGALENETVYEVLSGQTCGYGVHDIRDQARELQVLSSSITLYRVHWFFLMLASAAVGQGDRTPHRRLLEMH
jgi:hypothetical protein